MDYCPRCDREAVEKKDLEYPVTVKKGHIVAVKLSGSECTNCKAQYFDIKDLMAVEQMVKAREQEAVGA